MGAPTPIRSKADGVVAEAEEDRGGADNDLGLKRGAKRVDSWKINL